jgi:hypothetical protein
MFARFLSPGCCDFSKKHITAGSAKASTIYLSQPIMSPVASVELLRWWIVPRIGVTTSSVTVV